MNRYWSVKAVAKMAMVALACILFLVASWLGYFYVTYLDESIVSGSAYGLTIGETKHETYRRLPSAFSQLIEKDRKIFMEVKVEKQAEELLAVRAGNRTMIESRLDDVGFDRFSAMEQWDFYVGGSYRNVLRLTFCGDRLCKIYRHRQHFEFP